MTHFKSVLMVAALAHLVPRAALAQNMQVIGGNSMAQDCYRASTAAALTNSASRTDIEFCNKALDYGQLRRKDLIATYVNRGVINAAIQDFRAAAKDYNRAIELGPEVAEAYVNRGNLWFMANRFQEAVLDYDKALELGFSQPYVALLNRGMVKEQLGQLESARDDYQSALKEREDWAIAEQKLQRVNGKLEQRDLQQQPDVQE